MLAWIFGVFGMLLAGLGAGSTIRPTGLASEKHGQPSRVTTIAMCAVGILVWMLSRSGDGGSGWIASAIAFAVGLAVVFADTQNKEPAKADEVGNTSPATVAAMAVPRNKRERKKARQAALEAELVEALELEALLAEAERLEMEEAASRAAAPPDAEPIFESNRALPPGMAAALPAADTTEAPLREAAPSIGVGRTVIIDYCDAKGDHSRRQVTVKRLLDYGDDWAIDAWCHHRRANRTFLLSRVETMFLPDTGEVVDRPLDFLTGILHGPEGEAVARLEDDLTVLVYVARSDGQMLAKERAVIVDYVLANCGDDLAVDANLIEAEIKKFWNGSGTFYTALRRLKDEPTERRMALFHAAEAVMLADGKRKEGEEKALRSVRKLLGLTKIVPAA